MVALNADQALVALFAISAVFFLTLAVVLLWDLIGDWRIRRQVRQRIGPWEDERTDDGGKGGDSTLVRGREEDSRLTRALGGLPVLGDLSILLEQARVSWTPGMFVIASMGAATAAGLAAATLRVPLVGVVGTALVTGSLPWLYLRYRRLRRLWQFESEFPDAADLLARAARAGHPLTAGVTMVSQEGPPVVAEEFGQVADEIRFGLPFDEALQGLADRVDLMDVQIFVTAVLIQRESGGNLAEILDKIGSTIRTRFTLRRQLRVHTAQGRMSGYVLAALPILVGLALFAIDREYMMVLLVEPVGRAFVMGAVVMQILGFLWIRRIVNIEF